MGGPPLPPGAPPPLPPGPRPPGGPPPGAPPARSKHKDEVHAMLAPQEEEDYGVVLSGGGGENDAKGSQKGDEGADVNGKANGAAPPPPGGAPPYHYGAGMPGYPQMHPYSYPPPPPHGMHGGMPYPPYGPPPHGMPPYMPPHGRDMMPPYGMPGGPPPPPGKGKEGDAYGDEDYHRGRYDACLPLRVSRVYSLAYVALYSTTSKVCMGSCSLAEVRVAGAIEALGETDIASVIETETGTEVIEIEGTGTGTETGTGVAEEIETGIGTEIATEAGAIETSRTNALSDCNRICSRDRECFLSHLQNCKKI